MVASGDSGPDGCADPRQWCRLPAQALRSTLLTSNPRTRSLLAERNFSMTQQLQASIGVQVTGEFWVRAFLHS